MLEKFGLGIVNPRWEGKKEGGGGGDFSPGVHGGQSQSAWLCGTLWTTASLLLLSRRGS